MRGRVRIHPARGYLIIEGINKLKPQKIARKRIGIMNKIEISDTLLFKFFLGETTNDETDRIAAWLDANPEEHQNT